MVKLVILGEPMGKQRPKFSFKNGRAYTPQKTTSYENLVRHEYMSKYECMTFNENDYIHAEITAYFTLPKGDFGKKGLSKSGREKEAHNYECNTRADVDNIAKIWDRYCIKICDMNEAMTTEYIKNQEEADKNS